MMFTKLVAIACGGAVGSVLRYLVSGWGHRPASNATGLAAAFGGAALARAIHGA